MCGPDYCYPQSVKTKKICKPAYLAGPSFVNELLDTPNGFNILMGVICLIGVLLCLLQWTIDYFQASNWWLASFGNTAGNIVSLIIFLVMMITLNKHTFDIQSFCLMNNNESVCQNDQKLIRYSPRNIHCSAIYDNESNRSSKVMVHYDGYSGFVKIDLNTSETDFTRCI